MADNRLPRQAMQWKPLWRKKKERAKLTWIVNIKGGISERNLQEGQ
jgi:hypothetical protein